jgi:hypothetical protein
LQIIRRAGAARPATGAITNLQKLHFYVVRTTGKQDQRPFATIAPRSRVMQSCKGDANASRMRRVRSKLAAAHRNRVVSVIFGETDQGCGGVCYAVSIGQVIDAAGP